MTFASLVAEGRKPVVVQILPALNVGGVEQGVVDTSAEIVKAGGKSIVISGGGSRVKEIEAAGGIHVQLPVNSKNPVAIARNIKLIRKVIEDYKIDVVHACSRAPAWSAKYAVKGTAARFVTSCHSAHKISGGLKRFYNSSIASGERVIAVSAYLADYLVQNYGVNKSILRVIHRGIPLDRFDAGKVSTAQVEEARAHFKIPDGAKVFLLPARLTRIKGHQFTIDALKTLGRHDIFCLFLTSNTGTASFRSELEENIRAAGLEGKVVIGSYDMAIAYKLADVVLCPTIVPEGFGRVPVEAQAMGVPVITTDHGGPRETVEDGVTGWLVPPGDVAAYAKAMSAVLALTPAQRQEMAVKALENVRQRFTTAQMGRLTMDVYAELLG